MLSSQKILGKHLCDYIEEKHMPSLECEFDCAEYADSSGMDFDDFVEVLENVLGIEAPEEELQAVFDKMDTKSIGRITWINFLSYLLLELRLEERNSSVITELPINPNFRTPQFVHEDIICKIDKMPLISNFSKSIDYTVQKFVTVSKDGILALWSQSMELKKYKTINEKNFPKQKKFPWPLDMICLPNVSLIAISFTDESIKFYDSFYLDLKIILQNLNANVTCMTYWFERDRPEIGMLLLGDSGGNVTIFKFWNCVENKLFGVFSSMQYTQDIKFADVIGGKYNFVSVENLKALHNNWIKKVYYDPHMKLVISCCGSPENSVVVHVQNQSRIFNIPYGVNSIAFESQRNVLATGGIDRIIRLWNPYITAKPIASLMGHSSPINHLIFAGDDHFFSVSEDKCLKVWNLVDNICIQTIYFKNDAFRPMSASYYDFSKRILILAAIKVIVLEKIFHTDVDDNRNFISHPKPVTGFVFSDRNNLIVSTCRQGCVSFWDLDSGKRAFHVTKAHSELIDGEDVPKAITAVSLHESGIGLLTAGLDGYLKLWNMNNGGLEKTIPIPGPSKEIFAISSIAGRVYLGGWSKRIISCNSELDKDSIRIWPLSHKEDILSLTSLHSAFIVTGSWDGVIRICSVQSGYIQTMLSLSYTLAREDIQTEIETSMSVLKPKSQTSSIGKYSTAVSKYNPSSLNLRRLLASTTSVDRRKFRATHPEYRATKSQPDVSLKSSVMQSSNFIAPKHKRKSLNISSMLLSKLKQESTPIICLLSMEARNKKSPIGDLFAADILGRIQVWDAHPPGALMAIFSCVAGEDQYVCCMTTDSENKYLITGDSTGYIRVWYIRYYFSRTPSSTVSPQDNPDIRQFPFSLPKFKRIAEKVEERIAQFTPIEFSPYVHTETPCLLSSYRAHLQMIVQVAMVEKRGLLVTGSSDQSVRLWTIHGLFLGIFGDPRGWQLDRLIPHATKAFNKKVPSDVRKVGSAATLQVIRSGISSKWRKVRDLFIFHYLRGAIREKQERQKKKSRTRSPPTQREQRAQLNEIEKLGELPSLPTAQNKLTEFTNTKHCKFPPKTEPFVLPPIFPRGNAISIYHQLNLHDIIPLNIRSASVISKKPSKKIEFLFE